MLLELRLVPAALGGWAAASWAVTGEVRPVLGLGVVLVLLAIGLLWFASSRPLAATVAVFATVTGFVLLVVAVGTGGDEPLADLAQRKVDATVVGRVDSDPAVVRGAGPPRVAYRVTVESVRRPWEGSARVTRGSVTVFAPGGAPAPLLGARVELTGRVAAAQDGRRESAVVTVTGDVVVLEPPRRVFRVAQGLRDRLAASSAGLSADARGLVPALVDGDTSRVPTDLKDAMRVAGLSHLTAVSGTNVTIVCGGVVLGLGLLRVGPRWQVLGAALALICFVLIARPQPSVVRAAAMGAVGLLGMVQGRRGGGISALAAAVVTLCLVDPWLSRELGFMLSVTATAAIVLLGPWLSRVLGRAMPRWAAMALAVPLVAQIACGPILLAIQPSVALYAVPANLAAAPAVAPTTLLGFAALLIGPIWPDAGVGLAWLAGWGASWIALVGRTVAELPAATVPWRSGVLGGVLLLLAGAAVLGVTVAAVMADGRWKLLHRAGNWLRHGRRRWAAAVVVAMMMVCCVVVVKVRSSPWPVAGWRVVACDVGQGDGLVVSTGPGRAIVIDVGQEPAPIRGCLDRLDVEVLDLMVLTHFHADHVGGLAGALAGRSVGRVLVSPLPEPHDGMRSVTALLAERGLTPEVGARGLSGTAGEVTWEVLHPSSSVGRQSSSTDGESSDANNASLTLIVRAPGLALAALGDLEPLAQAVVGEVPVVDVVKVAHHGSRFQNVDLYRRLDPRLALISAGRDNDFGHPAPATLKFLEQQGVLVRRTDLLGDLAVGVGEQGLWVRGRSE